MAFLDAISMAPLLYGSLAVVIFIIVVAVFSVIVLTMIIIALFQRFKEKKDKEE